MRISDWSSDVCSSDLAVDAAFDSIDADGPASVLVVASGGAPVNPDNPHPNIATTATEDWNRGIALNLSGVFFCIRKFAQLRLARPLEHSRIITMTSGTGQLAVSPANPAYVASQAARNGLTRQVAYDPPGRPA